MSEASTIMRKQRGTHIIAWDVHSKFCEGGYIDERGREMGVWRRRPTSVLVLREAIESVPRPRRMVIEEGPLADWLARELGPHVDEMIVCDPRRNALIAKDGEKDDAIDWRKLAALCRSGHVKAVHHSQSLARSLFKQHVQLYHDRVRHRVSEGLKLLWRLRRLGVFIKLKDLKPQNAASRPQVIFSRLPVDPDATAKGDAKAKAKAKASATLVQDDVALLLSAYDGAVEQAGQMRKRLERMGRGEPMIRAFCTVPGVKWVRASTFFTYVDTPFRFKTKQQLWKYMGIGLERHHSGQGKVKLCLPVRYNRVLKGIILSAAKSAADKGNNVFADQYQRWLDEGCSPRIARRNVARSLATVMWGMWKSGSSKFEPARVSKPASAC
jgi:transposase